MAVEGMTTLTEPTPEEAAALLADTFHRQLIMMVAECTVHYEGRASSTLDRGERLILLKEDGTLLIHQASGVRPVNWQPPGARFSLSATDDDLVVMADRQSPREVVRIRLHGIRLLAPVPMEDAADLDLRETEADLVEVLRSDPSLIEAGLEIVGQEVDRKRGPIDLFALDEAGRKVVVEVKRVNAGLQAAMQLVRYIERERQMDERTRGILVAAGISEKAHRILLEHGLEFVLVDVKRLCTTFKATGPRQATLFSGSGDPGNN